MALTHPWLPAALQAWAMLERDAGNPELARELFKCAVKADPKSEPSWLVSGAAPCCSCAALGQQRDRERHVFALQCSACRQLECSL